MAKVSVADAYPSKWLSANDFADSDEMIVTLAQEPLEYKDFRQEGTDVPQRKPVIYFRSLRGEPKVKPLVCNKGNFEVLIGLLGDDTDDWAGKQIALGVEEVTAFGKRTMGVRIRQRLPKPKTATVTKSAPRSQPQPPPDLDDFSEYQTEPMDDDERR